MSRLLTLSALAFAAGALGALVNSLLLWGCGRIGLHALFDVNLAPPLSVA